MALKETSNGLLRGTFILNRLRTQFCLTLLGAVPTDKLSVIWGRFSKVPKLYGPFSGVTIPFVSQEQRKFNSSNLTVIFLFVTLKTCQKIRFPKQAVGNFTDGFSGPKSFPKTLSGPAGAVSQYT